MPIIKLLSALAIHLFFILFMYGMFLYYGYYPNIYWLQVIYYVFAMSILLLGLSWITSSIVIFFKDMEQLVAIIIQFGFWLTPIFWSMKIVPDKYHSLIELNPIVYIIEGYRNSMIYNKWFWEEPIATIYFWSITMIIFLIGGLTFNKLRPHFADVI